MARIFLSIIALMYLALSVWCSIAPETTSAKVGFSLNPGGGQSEFLVIYGGLELGLALIFLIPWLKKESTEYALLACLLIHGCLVVFRTASFLMFEGIEPFTKQLAIACVRLRSNRQVPLIMEVVVGQVVQR